MSWLVVPTIAVPGGYGAGGGDEGGGEGGEDGGEGRHPIKSVEIATENGEGGMYMP